MSKRAKRRREMRMLKNTHELFDQLSPDQKRYMGKVQLMKSLADEMHFPWDDIGALFDKATVAWNHLNLEQIVDHMCDELRRNHVEHPGKKLKIDGFFLQPEEGVDA
jgi:hypothetical protein